MRETETLERAPRIKGRNNTRRRAKGPSDFLLQSPKQQGDFFLSLLFLFLCFVPLKEKRKKRKKIVLGVFVAV